MAQEGTLHVIERERLTSRVQTLGPTRETPHARHAGIVVWHKAVEVNNLYLT